MAALDRRPYPVAQGRVDRGLLLEMGQPEGHVAGLVLQGQTPEAPARRRWDRGMRVDWGESTAPTATVRPARSATDPMSDPAPTTTTEVRSWSVSRMVRGRAPGAHRAVRTHARGEFQAAWMRPATRSST